MQPAPGPAQSKNAAMELFGSRWRDDVENVPSDFAKLRRDAVRQRLRLAHVAVGDGEQAQPVPIRFRLCRAIQLIIEAIGYAVCVEQSRNAQLRIRMSADAGLEEDEVIRVPRCSGRLSVSSWEMVRPVLTREGSTMGAPPVTSTAVATEPTFSCESIVASSPASKTTPGCRSVSNPSFRIVTV